MTWNLTASGHAAIPAGEATSNSVEQQLLAELTAVLSKPEYGGTMSLLRGVHVAATGLHVQVRVPVVEPEQQESAAAPRRSRVMAARVEE